MWSAARIARRSPHTPGMLDRIDLYDQVMPGVLTLVVVVPLVVTFVVSLVPALVLCSALGPGFGFEAIVGAIVVSGVLAALVGLILAEGLDRYFQRPVEHLPATDSSERVALVWPDARVIDRDAYLATIDDVVVETMGWTEDHVLRVRWQTLMPMAPVLMRDFAATDVGTGEVVGGCGYDTDPRDPTAKSIGIWVGPEHRGQGYGAEMLRLMIDHGERWHQGPLSLLTSRDNAAMRRLAVTAGGEEVEQFDHELPNGVEVPAVRYLFPPPLPAG